MKINVLVTAGVDGASVPGLDKYKAAKLRRNRGSPIRHRRSISPPEDSTFRPADFGSILGVTGVPSTPGEAEDRLCPFEQALTLVPRAVPRGKEGSSMAGILGWLKSRGSGAASDGGDTAKASGFVPQNRLEAALVRAADDPAESPTFYRELLAARLYVVQPNAPAGQGEVILKEGEAVHLQNVEIEGAPAVPAYSSLARLRETLTEEAGYLAFGARDLFEIVQGTQVALNPGLAYGKLFTVPEIEALLDGSLFQPAERFVAERDTQVLMGQPANYPHALVEALGRFFRGRGDVEAAYLVHFYNPETDEAPHSLVGLEVSGDWDKIAGEAGMVAEQIKVPDPPVDFVKVGTGGSLDDYFRRECEPFFLRASDEGRE